MILKLLFTFIFSAFCLLAKTTPIDKNQIDIKGLENQSFEVIVVFEKYNSKFHQEIISEINQIHGLTIGGYCESLKCFYLQVDPLVFKTKNEVFKVLELKTKKFLPVFKEGTTSSVVITNCQRN